MVLQAIDPVSLPAMRMDTLRCGKVSITLRAGIVLLLKVQEPWVRVKRKAGLTENVKNVSMPLLGLQNHTFLEKMSTNSTLNSTLPPTAVLLPHVNEIRHVRLQEQKIRM